MDRLKYEPDMWYAEARVRARRRKSPWNLLLVPTFLMGSGLTWFVLASAIAAVHQRFYGTHVFGQSETKLGGILMFIPIIFPSFIVGLAMSNVVVCCVPWARRALDQEAEGAAGTDLHSAMRDLFRFVVVILPIALALSILGAIDPFH